MRNAGRRGSRGTKLGTRQWGAAVARLGLCVDFKEILHEVNNGVAWVTLNKPDKLNALSWSTWAELEHAITLANQDDDTRVLVVTGAGRGFCSGTDLTDGLSEEDWQPRPFPGRAGKMRSRHLGAAYLYRCTKPTIAAVNGVAVGAGLSVALACDIRIAAESARFSSIFVKRALVPDMGATWLLPRLIGSAQALQMMWTGRMVSADEALAMGLVNEVVANEALRDRVSELATEIAGGPSVAIELTKRLVRDGAHEPSIETQALLEERLQAICRDTEDAVEGALAFAEKREPVFKGR